MSRKIHITSPVPITFHRVTGEIVFDGIEDFILFKKTVDKKIESTSFIKLDERDVKIEGGMMIIDKSKIDVNKPPELIIVGGKTYVFTALFKDLLPKDVLVRVLG